jgi:transcriptional regulator with XRE-family HTH domain
MTNRIAEIRKARGLTLQEVATRASTTNQQISHLERGRRKLSYEWMERLASALSCQPLDLVHHSPEAASGCEPVLSSREQDLLKLFRSLRDEEQEALWLAIQSMTSFVRRSSGSLKFGKQRS